MRRVIVFVVLALALGLSISLAAAAEEEPPRHRPPPIHRPITPPHKEGDAPVGAEGHKREGAEGQDEVVDGEQPGEVEECREGDDGCSREHTEQRIFGYFFCAIWLAVALYCCGRRWIMACCGRAYDAVRSGIGGADATAGERAKLLGGHPLSSDVLVSGTQHKIADLRNWVNAILPPRPDSAVHPFPQMRAVWRGTFSGVRGGVNEGTHDSSMTLEFRAGDVMGEGTDRWGLFHVDGSYNSASGRFAWTKIYPGHNTYYRGVWDGNALAGQWFVIRIEKNYAEEGTFQLLPNAKVKEQLQMSEYLNTGSAGPANPVAAVVPAIPTPATATNGVAPALSVDTSSKGTRPGHTRQTSLTAASAGSSPSIVFVSPPPSAGLPPDHPLGATAAAPLSTNVPIGAKAPTAAAAGGAPRSSVSDAAKTGAAAGGLPRYSAQDMV